MFFPKKWIIKELKKNKTKTDKEMNNLSLDTRNFLFWEFSFRLFHCTWKKKNTNLNKKMLKTFFITAWKNESLQCKQMETVAQMCQKLLHAIFFQNLRKNFGKKMTLHREHLNAQEYMHKQSNAVMDISSDWFRINSYLFKILF